MVLGIIWSGLLSLQPQPEDWYTEEERSELVHLYVPELGIALSASGSRYFCMPTEDGGGILMKKQAVLGLHWPVTKAGMVYECTMYKDDMRQKPWQKGERTPV